MRAVGIASVAAKGRFMHHLLDVLPDWFGLVLLTGVPAAVAIAAHAVFRRLVPPERLLPHHEVAGFLVAVVGVLYAVVLGFVVVTVWTSFDVAQRNADAEAGDVAEVFLAARELPEPVRSRVQSLLADYAFEVRDNEWPALTDGAQDPKARELLLAARETIAAAPIPAKLGTGDALRQATLRADLFATVRDLSIARRQRLLDAESRVPAVLYFALVIGGLIVMSFDFLFGIESRTLQLTMTGLVAASIGLLLGIIVELDRPYGHGIRVNSNAWTFVIRTNHMAEHRDTARL
jgi:hypothetical protein